jgi:hypothetical protein
MMDSTEKKTDLHSQLTQLGLTCISHGLDDFIARATTQTQAVSWTVQVQEASDSDPIELSCSVVFRWTRSSDQAASDRVRYRSLNFFRLFAESVYYGFQTQFRISGIS